MTGTIELATGASDNATTEAPPGGSLEAGEGRRGKGRAGRRSPWTWRPPKNLPELEADPRRYSIHLHQDLTYAQKYREDGSVLWTKTIDRDEVAALFAPEVDVDSGNLPPGCFRSLRRGRAVRDLVWVAPRVWDVSVKGRLEEPARAYRVPMPGLVFVCGRGDGFLALYAAREHPARGPLGDRAQLYHAPAYNVHDNGTVCKGNHHFTDDPLEAVGDFFRSYFAPEITGRGRSRRHPEDLEALWRELDGQEEYPCDDLVEAMTVGDLCTWLKRR